MMNEQVRRIMTTDPVIVNPEQTVEEVSNMMVTQKLQQIPVVEDGKFVGLVTSYDLWRNSHKHQDTAQMKVRDVMNTKVLKITPIDKVGTAAELFMDRRFKTLPVVNLRDELKGVVTAFDVIRYTLTKEYDHPILYPEVFEQMKATAR